MCKRVFSVYVGMVGVSVFFLEGLRVRGEEREGEKRRHERETQIRCLSYSPWNDNVDMCPEQNRTGHLSLCGTESNQLSHTAQGSKHVWVTCHDGGAVPAAPRTEEHWCLLWQSSRSLGREQDHS